MIKAPIFHEEWCSPSIKHALSYYYNIVRKLDGDIIEIGCWEGLSSVHLANLVYPEKLIDIDPFTGTSYEPYEADAYAKRDIEAIYRHNISNLTHGNVIVNKTGWKEYFEENKPQAKYIYVDGPHGYEDVCEQLQYLQHYVVDGGILIGDDWLAFESVRRAVHDVLGAAAIQTPMSEQTWVWRKGSNIADQEPVKI